jgi:hypothetical protein
MGIIEGRKEWKRLKSEGEMIDILVDVGESGGLIGTEKM